MTCLTCGASLGLAYPAGEAIAITLCPRCDFPEGAKVARSGPPVAYRGDGLKDWVSGARLWLTRARRTRP
jgi:hypothetical protein